MTARWNWGAMKPYWSLAWANVIRPSAAPSSASSQ